MTTINKFISELLCDFEWIDAYKGEDDVYMIMSEFIQRFLTSGVSDSKTERVAEVLLTDVNRLRATLLSALKLSLNRVQHQKKWDSSLEECLNISKLTETSQQRLISLVREVSELPESERLLKHSLEKCSKGTYVDSQWRMDIDVAQRSSLSVDPSVSLIWSLETADGGSRRLRVSPEMLVKLSAELDAATQAMQRAKRTKT